jgi:uncharacterized protein (DUF885 family)
MGERRPGIGRQAGAGSLDPEFERLAERTFKFIVSADPVRASWLGIHGKNDALLPDRSAEARKSEIEGLQELLKRFEALESHPLSSCQMTEMALARGFLGCRIVLEERRPSWRIMPQSYLESGISGLYVLILRKFAPPEERAHALLGRLKALPELLRQAQANVEEPPVLFTNAAVLYARGAQEFLHGAVNEFISDIADAGLRHQCERAAAEAGRSLEAYSEYLLGSLMTRSTGEFRIGKTLFNRLLREQHMIPFDADDLVVLGEKIYHETLREVRYTAARIRPGFNWSRLLRQLKEENAGGPDLLERYAAAVRSARRFVEEHRLVTVPPGEHLEVVPTPAFARPFYPYAGYIPPAPFESGAIGTFWVTPTDPNDPVERQNAVLREHCRFGVPVLALHEGYPGHHVQLSRANQVDRRLRTLFTSPTMAEGWALYCEELMYEQGFFGDERVRLLQLRDQLWRACRVIVDVGLHTGKMSFNDAVSFLVRKAKLERAIAAAEVRRYCENPTQPMSYVVGKLLIQELRDDYRAARGDAFSLRQFHDDLLSHGTIPIELLRKEMGVPRRNGEKEWLRILTRANRPVPPNPRVRRTAGHTKTAQRA